MAEQKAGKKIIIIDTPILNVDDNVHARKEAEDNIKLSKKNGATLCFPHHASAEQLVNKNKHTLDRLPDYLSMVRQNGMIPGLSAHMPELIVYSDENNYDVESYIIALDAITMATLRDVVGGMTLSHTLESREVINSKLRAVLDEHTSRFGIKVTSVEIKAIDPPGDFTKAMEEEKRAEITKIANITISEGEKQAEINRAEGGKQAAITTAEGQSEAMKRKALGEKEAAILRAEGRSTAYVSLFKALSESNISEEAIAVRYLEALEKVADGNATTLILPNEASGILGSMAAIVKTIGATSGETLAKEVTDHFLGSNSGEDPPSDPGK